MRHPFLLAALALPLLAMGQEIHYSGKTLNDPYLLDGGLRPAIGVHNIQTMRTSRSRGLEANGGTCVCPPKEAVLYPAEASKGWTYNHQPMMAYWHGRYWLHYLSGPLGEHIPSSITWLQTSADGYQWSAPEALFPEYELQKAIMDGSVKVYNADGSLHKVSTFEEHPNQYPRQGLKAIMHQRVGWYVSSEKTGKRLLAIGNYGICLHRKDDPNDGNGIGRVVREVYEDGTMGPVYFFYYNHGWNEKNTNFPWFGRAKDKKFRAAVQEILDSPLYWMQFVEECDRQDPHLPVANEYKAFCYYTLPDGETLVSLWKHALTSHSNDGGRTWLDYQGQATESPARRAPGFVNSNAKIWGQRLTDGSYATVYNPSEFRWPLALSTSADGLDYTTLSLVHGDITQMRYGGNYKSNGPQYVRGILPGNGTPADNDLWVSYSVNKEDMWVAHVPVPLRLEATSHATAREIGDARTLSDLSEWNIYSPVLAPVTLQAAGSSLVNGAMATMDMQPARLELSDSDPFDYAKADRLFPGVRHLSASLTVTPRQADHGELQIELCDAAGHPASRLWFQPDGLLTIKTGARYTTVCKYAADQTYDLDIDLDLDTRIIAVKVNSAEGRPTSKRAILYATVPLIERITLRTGSRRTDLTPDTKADRAEYEDLENTEALAPKASFVIHSLKTAPAGETAYTPAVLRFNNYLPYVDYFNRMEDEHVKQLIPNAEAAAWMEREIPLFDCADRELEEMYYYRWWALRKHIVKTNQGYAQTEFLVKRSYSDTLNLISCAVSHHIMEARWLHNTDYAHTEATTWYTGKNGGPLPKFYKFSSLVPVALMADAAVLGHKQYFEALRPSMEADLKWWEQNRQSTDGMFWQEDVQDAMEEQISAGKRVKGKFRYQQRPTINSYMAANYRVLGHTERAEALTKQLAERLWDDSLQFFCSRIHRTMPKQGKALPGDSLAQVRELIGFLPWYCQTVADDPRYAAAWQQIADPRGFDAPFGLSTAERRHPLFRKNWHGRPTCEWDGGIWPFATSQTLTALINVKKNYPQTSALVADSLFHYHLKKYAESMHRRGRPYVGEYLDETDGQWLWGDHQRSRYYNHSTFADLIITGLCGLTPSLDTEQFVQPLADVSKMPYFCLDGVRYHGHTLTLIWDADGTRYHQGRGLTLLIDGRRAAQRADMGRLSFTL